MSCAALTETLLESELFGHEKGAFTGAVARRRGQVRAGQRRDAASSTRSATSAPKLQLDLLRVLEDAASSCRVGGNEAVDVDVRIVAATNRDLTEGGRPTERSARTSSTG